MALVVATSAAAEERAEETEGGIIPVSYTHLDVYKRQAVYFKMDSEALVEAEGVALSIFVNDSTDETESLRVFAEGGVIARYTMNIYWKKLIRGTEQY